MNTTAGMVVVKKPNHLLFKKYQDKGESTTQELDKLVAQKGKAAPEGSTRRPTRSSFLRDLFLHEVWAAQNRSIS